MDDKEKEQNKDENAMADREMEDISGGLFSVPGQCSCYAPITEGGVLKCKNCGRVYGQAVP